MTFLPSYSHFFIACIDALSQFSQSLLHEDCQAFGDNQFNALSSLWPWVDKIYILNIATFFQISYKILHTTRFYTQPSICKTKPLHSLHTHPIIYPKAAHYPRFYSAFLKPYEHSEQTPKKFAVSQQWTIWKEEKISLLQSSWFVWLFFSRGSLLFSFSCLCHLIIAVQECMEKFVKIIIHIILLLTSFNLDASFYIIVTGRQAGQSRSGFWQKHQPKVKALGTYLFSVLWSFRLLLSSLFKEPLQLARKALWVGSIWNWFYLL